MFGRATREHSAARRSDGVSIAERSFASRRTGLPTAVLERAESFFHQDFSTLRVHRSSPEPRRIGAAAFARGEEIHFAPGVFSSGTRKGRALLGHELAHVVQQREGQVPRADPGSQGIVDSAAHEREAAKQALSFVRTVPIRSLAARECGGPPVSRKTAPPVIQPIRIGLRPEDPSDFRTGHYDFNNINTARTTPDQGGRFDPSQYNPVNQVRAAGVRGLRLARLTANKQISDYDDTALLNRAAASQLAPEVDHIVPVRDSGANDPYNARVLSQEQNNDRAVDRVRPAAGEREIAVYERLDIEYSSRGRIRDLIVRPATALSQRAVDLLYASRELRRRRRGGAPNITTARGQAQILRDLGSTRETSFGP